MERQSPKTCSEQNIGQRAATLKLRKTVRSSLFESMRRSLIKKTENSIKISLCDKEAFEWKLKRSSDNDFLETHSLINVDRSLKKQGEVTLEDLRQIDFPVLAYTNAELIEHSMKILQDFQFANEKIGKKMLSELITQMSKNYNIVPYHNFSHAFSLSLMLYQCFEKEIFFRKHFTSEELVIALIAGLAHDLNHPGTNNAYELKIQSKIAIQSNNESILQKFHIRELWRILKKQDSINFLKVVEDEAQTRNYITKLILSTDMSKHFASMNILKNKSIEQKCVQNLNHDDQHFYLEQLFHSCDIGNPCIDFEGYINWGALLSYQFNTQTKLQAENEVEVTEFFKFKSLKLFYEGQIGFINTFVLPIWKEMSGVWPGLTCFTNNVEANLAILKQKKDIQIEKQKDEERNKENNQ